MLPFFVPIGQELSYVWPHLVPNHPSKANIYEAKVNIKVSFFDISASIFNIIGLKNNMFLAWIEIFNMPYYYITWTILQYYDNCMLNLT